MRLLLQNDKMTQTGVDGSYIRKYSSVPLWWIFSELLHRKLDPSIRFLSFLYPLSFNFLGFCTHAKSLRQTKAFRRWMNASLWGEDCRSFRLFAWSFQYLMHNSIRRWLSNERVRSVMTFFLECTAWGDLYAAGFSEQLMLFIGLRNWRSSWRPTIPRSLDFSSEQVKSSHIHILIIS